MDRRVLHTPVVRSVRIRTWPGRWPWKPPGLVVTVNRSEHYQLEPGDGFDLSVPESDTERRLAEVRELVEAELANRMPSEVSRKEALLTIAARLR